MARSEIRPLTGELFERFYGFRSPFLIRGVAMLVDDEVVAIGGIVLIGAVWVAFSDIPEAARAFKKTLYAGALQVRRMFETCKLPVVADRDENEPTSRRFLTRLGFHEEDEFWRY